jgi:2-desacetyl-2-hydroxyethyl bacteriochlorophyllide A dehydrogenase
MKALVCTTPGRIDLIDAQKPSLSKGRAIIRVTRIGICGTDLHAFEGTQPYFTYPRILGHEVAGELIDIDGETEFKKGELVTFIPYIHCGNCPACRQGKTNCCEALKVCGVHVDGAMSEYFAVPANLLINVRGLSKDEVALIEPLSIAAHAVRRADVHSRQNVVVAGAGPIGFGIIQFAKARGAEVTVIDVNEDRLNFCRETLGISNTIHALQEDAVKKLKEFTDGSMAAVVFDASGNLRALEDGFKYMGHASKYILVGLQLQNISFSHPEFHKREGTLMSSRNATREDFEQVIEAITQNKIDPLQMISHHVRFDRVPELFPSWLDTRNKVLKVVVELD